jgi:exodeoxyribonuclease VII large subunit
MSNITIKDIGMIINKSLPKDKFNIKCEIMQPKISNGHMYMNLKDNGNIISGIMWKSNINNCIKNVKDGDMVECTGKLEYYVPRGALSLVLSDIKKSDNMGDMYKEYEMLKQHFNDIGYFNKKNITKIPEVIKNILILSSLNGAAIHDFYYALKGKMSINMTTVDVLVQGNMCANDIIMKLTTLDLSPFDMIVITRGGGSMEDLWGFNNKELIECIYNCNKPVLSAIGHMVDTTLIDMVADISAPTPSLAGQYIVDHNMKYINKLNNMIERIKSKLITNINNNIKKLNNMSLMINKKKYEIISNFNNFLDTKCNIIKQNIINNISHLDNMYNKFNNNNISIHTIKNKNIDNSVVLNKLIQKNKPFIMIWNNIKILISDYKNID